MDILITAIIAFFIGAGYITATNESKQKKRSPTGQYRPSSQHKERPKEPPLDQQFLTASKTNQYQKQYLLNKAERKIYWSLVKHLKGKYCINPQASLGEVISCDNDMGFRAINSKRSDFVITDKNFRPVAVIEYQGSGHYQGNFKIREETKFNALRNAGVAYIELHQEDDNYIYQKLVQCGFIKDHQ